MKKNCLSDIDVIVLAGGLGTRIANILPQTPKILAPINNHPFIFFLLSWLKKFGACRIVFSLGYLAEQVEDYLSANRFEGMDFLVVNEDKPMGTAGAIYNARSKIRSDLVLVINGDSLIDANLCEFVAFHKSGKTSASILCNLVSESDRYGLVEIDKNNRIISFKEKLTNQGKGSISAGVYLFNSSVLDEIFVSGPSIEKDFFQKQPAGRVAGMEVNREFIDIGTPKDLRRASNFIDRYFK